MISINISELIWTVINFFLLLFLLKRFLYTPILRVMEERQARTDALFDEERRAKESVQENDARLAAEKARSREEASRFLSESGSAQEQRRIEALSQARKSAQAFRQEAQTQLAAQSEAEQAQLAAARPELAALLAGRLLGEEEQA